MDGFHFHIPTEVIYGCGSIQTLKEKMPSQVKRILVVTDKKVAEKSGAINTLRSILHDRDVFLYDEVSENPVYSILEKGKTIARDVKAEWILGVGGGSPMDAAKGIALLVKNPGPMKEYIQGKTVQNNPLPIVCIPTTSGTGSEVTPFAVFSDPDAKTKEGFSHHKIFPVFSIIDPELTYSMPESVIINTGLDALTHAIEAFLSTLASPLTDLYALESIRLVIDFLEKAVRKERESINRMALSSMMAGVAIAHCSTILLHIMGYPLTVFHGIPHGKANAILLPSFMDFMRTASSVQKKVNIVEQMFEVSGGIVSYLDQFGIKTHLSSYGIEKDELNIFAKKVIVKGDVEITPAIINETIIMELYKTAF